MLGLVLCSVAFGCIRDTTEEIQRVSVNGLSEKAVHADQFGIMQRAPVGRANNFNRNHGTFQAHIPTYILNWLTAIINPIIYVVCNPTYRESAAKKLSCLQASLSKFYKKPPKL